MKNSKFSESVRQQISQTAFQGGSYSIILTAIVLAILIVVNICAEALPTALTKLDISSTKLYSVTSNTKVVVNNLQKDVTVYWIVQSQKEDDVIENLLGKYESLSDHIQVVKKNPDVFPTFAQQYTAESVQNNSLVVECGDKNRYISYDEIYLTSADMYSYSYTTSFDGEGAITSAIAYVVSDELPTVYMLAGHGEQDVPDSFLKQVEKENIDLQTLSLLTADEIPEDAAAVWIYAPQSDISSEEAQMLLDYANGGGKLLVMAGPVEDQSLDNLYSVLEYFDVTRQEGIVIEGDRDHYAFQRPYILIPEMGTSEITQSLEDANYMAIMPLASGLIVPDYSSSVTAVLSTSEAAYSKAAGFALQTYDKEEGDAEGLYALAVAIDCRNDGRIVWFSSSDFLDDMYNAYSSGANNDLAMNSMSYLIGQSEAMAIRSKSLNYNYLTISESEATSLKALMIAILPIAYLAIGVLVVVETRRKQHEAE